MKGWCCTGERRWALGEVAGEQVADICAQVWRERPGCWRWQTLAPVLLAGEERSAGLAMEAAEIARARAAGWLPEARAAG